MKFFTSTAIAMSMLSSSLFYAKIIEYVEDAYTMQAPQEVVDLVERAAQFFEFTDPYEVIAPKKAGMQVNPWNRFISYGINSQTKNPFIIVNYDWFSQIPSDQQLFLLGRNFLILKYGTIPLSMKVVPFAFMVMSMMLIFLLFWLLGKTKLAHHSRWVRALIAWVIVVCCNIAFMNKLPIQLNQYLGRKYDAHINELAVQKTHNRDAAVGALEHFDASVKHELKSGEPFFAPYAMLFETYAKELKK
jgi:hypothetical protein